MGIHTKSVRQKYETPASICIAFRHHRMAVVSVKLHRPLEVLATNANTMIIEYIIFKTDYVLEYRTAADIISNEFDYM